MIIFYVYSFFLNVIKYDFIHVVRSGFRRWYFNIYCIYFLNILLLEFHFIIDFFKVFVFKKKQLNKVDVIERLKAIQNRNES